MLGASCRMDHLSILTLVRIQSSQASYNSGSGLLKGYKSFLSAAYSKSLYRRNENSMCTFDILQNLWRNPKRDWLWQNFILLSFVSFKNSYSIPVRTWRSLAKRLQMATAQEFFAAYTWCVTYRSGSIEFEVYTMARSRSFAEIKPINEQRSEIFTAGIHRSDFKREFAHIKASDRKRCAKIGNYARDSVERNKYFNFEAESTRRN